MYNMNKPKTNTVEFKFMQAGKDSAKEWINQCSDKQILKCLQDDRFSPLNTDGDWDYFEDLVYKKCNQSVDEFGINSEKIQNLMKAYDRGWFNKAEAILESKGCINEST